MGDRPGRLRLGAFFNPTGHHVAGWRHARAQADAGVNFQHYAEIARTAERGKFDMLFLADNLSVREASREALSRSAQYIANMEPVTLISALAAVTSRIGVVATASTSYNEPFHVARKFASIDHISGGRAGWNLVTSALRADAWNFSRDEHYEHGVRYARAAEFAEVVLGLWDSWAEDAFIRDKESGVFLDPDKVRRLDHKGPWFAVRGPLNVPRSPQGRPVIVQAGGSADMVAVAARFAEVIFCAPLDMQQGRDLYATLKGALAQHGRSADDQKIMPGLSCIIGDTEKEAREKQAELDALTHPEVAREILSTVLSGVDLSGYDFDAPMPQLAPPQGGSLGIFKHVMELARTRRLTLGETARMVAGARGKFVVCGTASQIADVMQDWFRSYACDGFNIMPPYLPGSLEEFVDKVIPELLTRGLFRTEYEGRTLRENLGLRTPVRAA
ncbi:MAG TPA: LLM class flavin-dependent oxidoreductase [Beijerinckiaceae bacterium]|jgi:FMN-dependent oxidoreductase (nitrilotriacetate monooxygenase family)